MQLIGGFRHALLDLGARRASAAPVLRFHAAPVPAIAPVARVAEAPDPHPAVPCALVGHWEMGDDGQLCLRWRVTGDAEAS